MRQRLGRPLPVIGVAVVAAIAVMAIVGWIIASTGHTRGGRPFDVTVLNDRDSDVTIQPCARYFCNKFPPVNLTAGSSHSWQTDDGDTGVYSFVVEAAPGGRILGCLSQHGLTQASAPLVVRVSTLEKCIS